LIMVAVPQYPTDRQPGSNKENKSRTIFLEGCWRVRKN
jgi:hypothetical protein